MNVRDFLLRFHCSQLLAACFSLLLFFNDLSAAAPLGPTRFVYSEVSLNFAGVADLDGDGDLDFSLRGFVPFQGFKVLTISNNGGQFAEMANNLALPEMISWKPADFNGDGRIDVAGLVGGASGPEIRLWKNTAAGWIPVEGALPVTSESSFYSWGDLDGDGDLDLLCPGQPDGGKLRLWRNDRSGFVVRELPITGVSRFIHGRFGPAKGMDILVSTSGGIRLYENNGIGTFKDTGRIDSKFKANHWIPLDFDSDFDLDLLVRGQPINPDGTLGNEVVFWLRNDGTTFSSIPFGNNEFFPLASLDLDSDGDLDLVGRNTPNSKPRFWFNHQGQFSDSGMDPFAEYESVGLLEVGDFDGDRKIDFLVGAMKEGKQLAAVIPGQDLSAAPTGVPLFPQHLTFLDSSEIRLAWSLPDGFLQTSVGFTYNVRIGTGPGKNDVVPSFSSDTGARAVSQPGNAGSTRLVRYYLDPGVYYWGVQLVDSSFNGGPFLDGGTFQVQYPGSAVPQLNTLGATSVGTTNAVVLGEIDTVGVRATCWFEWGKTTNYGNISTKTNVADPDFVTLSFPIQGLEPDTVYHYRLVATNGFPRQFPFVSSDSTFTTARFVPGPALPLGLTGAFAWADYDRDGDLDAVFGGRLFRNDNGAFAEQVVFFRKGSSVVSAWGDYDGDGWPDLIQVGGDGFNSPTLLWRNTGASFVSIPNLLPASDGWSVEWGDFDNDGDQDLVVGGNTLSPRFQIWRNSGGSFQNVGTELPSYSNPVARWVDYDGDSDLDLVLSGYSTLDQKDVTRLARNDSGVFTIQDLGLPANQSFMSAWADFDGDGDLDAALRGSKGGTTSMVWRNDGPVSGFSPVGPIIGNASDSGLQWGDFDNDGDLDLVLGGNVGNAGDKTYLYRNTGGEFLKVESPIPANGPRGSSLWVDFDGDGDLDFCTGVSLWRNAGIATALPPAAPSGLSQTITRDRVILNWIPGAGNGGASAGISHNIRIGTSPGAGNVAPALSLANGRRLVPGPGNVRVGNSTSLSLLELSPGTYYWAVQAVSQTMGGGEFSAESSFTVGSEEPVATSGNAKISNGGSVELSGRATSRSVDAQFAFEYGLTQAYGTRTAFVPFPRGPAVDVNLPVMDMLPGREYHYRIVLSYNASEYHGLDRTISIPWFKSDAADVSTSSNAISAWGDLDADGDQDLVVLLGEASNVLYVYKADGSGFLPRYAIPSNRALAFEGLLLGDLSNSNRLEVVSVSGFPRKLLHWGPNVSGDFVSFERELQTLGPAFGSTVIRGADFDNDGDADVLFSGGDTLQLLLQTNGTHSLAPLPTSVSPAPYFSVFPADYDADGDLDLLVNHFQDPEAGGVRTALFRNVAGKFIRLNIPMPVAIDASASWGDFDGDGDLDLAFSGTFVNEGFLNTTRIYRNDGTDLAALPAAFPFARQSQWADINGDGRLDLVLSAGNGVWINNGDSTFSEIYTGFGGGRFSIVDRDGDGDLDLFVDGRIWRNGFDVGNTRPSSPAGLQSLMTGTRIRLMWSPADDPETPTPALGYNIRVGTAPGKGDIIAPQSDLVTGNLFTYDSLRLRPAGGTYLDALKLPVGRYYWSVQAVDSGRRAGPWSEESTFDVTVVVEADVNPRSAPDQIDHGDGLLTISDWVQVGRFAAGLDLILSERVFQKVDCAPLATSGDGRITVADWVQAGRFAAGLDAPKPIAGPDVQAP